MSRSAPKHKVIYVKVCARCRKPIETCCGDYWTWKRTLVLR